MSESTATFDEERATAYDDKIRRLAPGYDVLHDTIVHLADTMLPEDAHLLIAGAGEELVRMDRT